MSLLQHSVWSDWWRDAGSFLKATLCTWTIITQSLTFHWAGDIWHVCLWDFANQQGRNSQSHTGKLKAKDWWVHLQNEQDYDVPKIQRQAGCEQCHAKYNSWTQNDSSVEETIPNERAHQETILHRGLLQVNGWRRLAGSVCPVQHHRKKDKQVVEKAVLSHYERCLGECIQTLWKVHNKPS